jgi:hypothetical protein
VPLNTGDTFWEPRITIRLSQAIRLFFHTISVATYNISRFAGLAVSIGVVAETIDIIDLAELSRL